MSRLSNFVNKLLQELAALFLSAAGICKDVMKTAWYMCGPFSLIMSMLI